MLLKSVKFTTLFLVLCNIPGFLLVYTNPSLASAASYLTSLLLIVFFFFKKPWQKPIVPLLVFTILYFNISGLNYAGEPLYYFKEFIRFTITVVCITQVMYHTKYNDIFYILLIAGLSIIINGIVFPSSNVIYGLVKGRYSGFLLNPNTAGITCMLGMALSYSIKNSFWRMVGQAIFTFAGILTLSRTFIVVWVIINFLAVIRNRKNLIAPLIGALGIITVITFADNKNFATDRFEALTSFFTGGEVKTKTIGYDTRDESWANYYDLIFEKPFIGHGFMSFQEPSRSLPGAHNSYLMIIGESGILTLLLFLGILGYLFKYSLQFYKEKSYLLLVLVVVMLNLMASHTFFFNYQSVSLIIFVYVEIRKSRELVDSSILTYSS